MTITGRDLDRQWSSDEVAALSEKELTKLAFLRDYKNLVFFIPAVPILCFASVRLGAITKIAVWICIVMFSVFALQGLFNTILVFVSLVGGLSINGSELTKNTFWKCIQLLISFGIFAIYAGLSLVLFVCAA